MRKYKILTVILGLGLTLNMALAGKNNLEFKADKSVVKTGEKICFTFKNNSKGTVILPNSAPWIVISLNKKNEGKIVYAPIATLNLVPVEPSKSINWCWDLKAFEDKTGERDYVRSGKYLARLTVFVNKKKLFLKTTFKVKSSLSSIFDKDKKDRKN